MSSFKPVLFHRFFNCWLKQCVRISCLNCSTTGFTIGYSVFPKSPYWTPLPCLHFSGCLAGKQIHLIRRSIIFLHSCNKSHSLSILNSLSYHKNVNKVSGLYLGSQYSQETSALISCSSLSTPFGADTTQDKSFDCENL